MTLIYMVGGAATGLAAAVLAAAVCANRDLIFQNHRCSVSPEQRAIEFGEYLAKAAERYQSLLSTGPTCSRCDSSDDETEAYLALNSAIYEFRKRAAKVPA